MLINGNLIIKDVGIAKHGEKKCYSISNSGETVPPHRKMKMDLLLVYPTQKSNPGGTRTWMGKVDHNDFTKEHERRVLYSWCRRIFKQDTNSSYHKRAE